MAIKSVMKEEEKRPAPYYPILKKSTTNNQVVLFTATGVGIVVSKGTMGANPSVGIYNTSWAENMFEPFHGTITLSNKE